MKMGTFSAFSLDRSIRYTVSAILKNYGSIAQRREFDVKFDKMGQSAGFLGSQIINVEIHSLVFIAVREEVDLISTPHWDNVLGRIIGQVRGCFGLKIVNPNIVCLSAAIAFPGSKFPENPVVGEFILVRGERAEPASR